MKQDRMAEVFAMSEHDLMEECHKIYGGIYSENNFLWIPNKQTNFLLQAHTDTVAKGKFEFELRSRRMVIDNAFQNILGGDDRAGVLAIEELYRRLKGKKKPIPSILLTCGEESGSHGMKAFVDYLKALEPKERFNLFSHIHLFLALDRKGFGEFVHYCKVPDKIVDYLEQWGFHKGWGTFSDIKYLTEYTWIPHANLSIGYHDPHGNGEYMVMDEWFATVNRIQMMLEDPPPREPLAEKDFFVSHYKWNQQDEEDPGIYGMYGYGGYGRNCNKNNSKHGKWWKNNEKEKVKNSSVIVYPQNKGLSADATKMKDIIKENFPRALRRDEVCSNCGINARSMGFFSSMDGSSTDGDYWLCEECANTYSDQMLPLGTEYVYGFEKTNPDLHRRLEEDRTKYLTERNAKEKESQGGTVH